MASWAARSASETRSAGAFSRAVKRVRHDSSCSAPRRAASSAARSHSVSVAGSMRASVAVLDAHPAAHAEDDLHVAVAVVELEGALATVDLGEAVGQLED